MKKITLVLLSFAFTAAAFSQKKAVEVVTVNTPTVQCDMCKEAIETYLKRVDGVTFVNVKVKQKKTQVKYLTDRTNLEMVKASIANAGYDADEIKANPDSYKMLPKCCKKPEDRGAKSKQ